MAASSSGSAVPHGTITMDPSMRSVPTAPKRGRSSTPGASSSSAPAVTPAPWAKPRQGSPAAQQATVFGKGKGKGKDKGK